MLFTVFIVLLLDQVLKIYIKTHFHYGQEVNVLGNWFKLHFIENEGMAFGMEIGGPYGKLILTSFRLIACIAGIFLIKKYIIDAGYSSGRIFCASLILAGALGNCIDSVAYGKIFTDTPFHGSGAAKLVPWGQGYASLFHGRVVDMLYFPLIDGHYPIWFPVVGGKEFQFFRPIFNIADAAISGGVIAIFVFQRSILQKKPGFEVRPVVEQEVVNPEEITEQNNHSVVS